MSELHSSVEEITDDVIIPDTDKKKYRALKLKNEMKLLLIHDPDADMSAAALDVSVGHLSNPENLPGLAHFCEHMVFLGTEKNPSENAFSEFVSTHGGKSNAYTTKENTNFHFEIKPSRFKEALDMFAQFFICPLFTESAMEREITAVDHENKGKMNDDIRRRNRVESMMSKPGHPYGRFGAGNRLSLETIPKEKGINTREELLKFHDKYYSSNLMGLAVLCKEPLDEMTKYVCELFGEVVNKNVEEPSWSDHPYGPEELRKRVCIVPVKDVRRLVLIWPCEDLDQWTESSPGRYLDHVFSNEGSGGLLSQLKVKGWANFVLFSDFGANGFSSLSATIGLTEDGLVHVDDVMTLVYQYIKMIKEEQPQQRIMEEWRDLSMMSFMFSGNDMSLSLLSTISKTLKHQQELKEFVSGSRLRKRFDAEPIKKLLNKMTPDNMMSLVVSKTFASNTDLLKESWYGVEYFIERHDLELEATWSSPEPNECFKLPEPNKFIPSNFEICERDTEATEYPSIIKDTSVCRCWFKQDSEFLLPKGYVNIAITSPLVNESPLNDNLMTVFVDLFDDMFSEHRCDADQANLWCDAIKTCYGLRLSVYGFVDKLPVLMECLLMALTNLPIDEQRFTLMRDQVFESHRNFYMAKPTSHAQHWLDLLLYEQDWTIDELLICEDELTIESLTRFISSFFSSIHIEMLVYGNFTQSSAEELSELVVTSLTTNRKCKPLPASQRKRMRGRNVELPKDTSYIYTGYNDVHSSSCVYVYLQVGPDDVHTGNLLELLQHIMVDSCFDTLRTKEQLGYDVRTEMQYGGGVIGLLIVVESEKHPQYVESRIEAFLASFQDQLENLSDADYDEQLSGLLSVKLLKPKRMSAVSSQYWAPIWTGKYEFNRREVEAEKLKSATKSQLVDFFKEHIASDSKRRRKLSVHIKSKQHRDEFKPDDEEAEALHAWKHLQKTEMIGNHVNFKRCLKLYPLPTPAPQITNIGGGELKEG